MSALTQIPELKEQDEYFMGLAIQQAQKAQDVGEVPIGAIIVAPKHPLEMSKSDDGVDVEVTGVESEFGDVVGSGFNQPIRENDPSAHAEVVAIRMACRQMNNYRLPGATLYVTVEPCVMCAGAIIHSRISRCVYGAQETKAGSIGHLDIFNQPWLNHKVAVHGGVCGDQCSKLMSHFFANIRESK